MAVNDHTVGCSCKTKANKCLLGPYDSLTGECTTCPPFSKFSEYNQICECKTGVHNVDTNTCGNTCPTGSTYSEEQNKCICDEGYNYIKRIRKCGKCPEGSTYNASKQRCICKKGPYNQDNNTCTECENGPYDSSNNKCTECLSFETYNKEKGECEIVFEIWEPE